MPDNIINPMAGFADSENEGVTKYDVVDNDSRNALLNEQQLPVGEQTEQDRLDEITELLEAEGLAKRYPGKHGKELLGEVAKSYKNAEGFIETLKREKLEVEAKNMMADRIIAQWQQSQMQQQQTQQQAEPQFATEEDRLAYEFSQKYIVPKYLAPIQQQMTQNNDFIGSKLYALDRALVDDDFKSAYNDGTLAKRMQERGLPMNRFGVDMAYESIQNDKLRTVSQSQQQIVAQDQTQREDAKRRAKVEDGGQRNVDVRPTSKLDKYKDIKDPDKLQELLVKELGIEVMR
jgi:hypothetical protein